MTPSTRYDLNNLTDPHPQEGTEATEATEKPITLGEHSFTPENHRGVLT